jgi:hypothetical protein
VVVVAVVVRGVFSQLHLDETISISCMQLELTGGNMSAMSTQFGMERLLVGDEL